MKITLFAATGGIGHHVLERALAAGHEVTAAVRSPDRIPGAVPALAIDLASPDGAVLRAAVAGADAVLCPLGPRSAAEVGIVSGGVRAIAAAMGDAGARRLVTISAAPVATIPSPARPHPPAADPGDGFWMRHLLVPLTRAALRRPYADLVAMEDVLRAGDLEWTVLRPPRLTDRPATGAYRTALGCNLRRGLTIARADVADCMLAVLHRPETIGQTVGVAY